METHSSIFGLRDVQDEVTTPHHLVPFSQVNVELRSFPYLE